MACGRPSRGCAAARASSRTWGSRMVCRSSLSYVNGHRPWQLNQNVFHLLDASCQSQLASSGGARRKTFRLENKLVSLDSSVIDLRPSMYRCAKFLTTKGAIKLHLLLDHDGYLPSFAVITTGKVHDVTVAKTLKLQSGTNIVDDRGYNDYELFGRRTDEGGVLRDAVERQRRVPGDEESARSWRVQ